MDNRHEGQQLGTPTGICNRSRQPRPAAPKRVLGGRKPHSERPLPKRLRLTNPERSILAEIGKRLGREALTELIAKMAKENSGWVMTHCRSLGQFRPCCFGSDHRQYLASTRDRTAPKHSQTTNCKDFIRSHPDMLAGMDFFTCGSAHLERARHILCLTSSLQAAV